MGVNVVISIGEEYFYFEIGLDVVKYWKGRVKKRVGQFLDGIGLRLEYMIWMDILILGLYIYQRCNVCLKILRIYVNVQQFVVS